MTLSIRKTNFDHTKVQETLAKSWSIKSSSKYTNENPAKGQCSVTALVLQTIYGGAILKTSVNGAWHFYNRIEGEIYDLSLSQFEQPPQFDNIPSSREEAFNDTSEEQYGHLLHQFKSMISE